MIKAMTKKLVLAAFVAALALTSCQKDPTPEPTPEPQTVTRLASLEAVTSNGMMTMNAFRLFTWENGRLEHLCDSIVLPIMTTITHDNLFYENGNHVKTEEETGLWQHHYIYEDGLLASFFTLQEGDTIRRGKIVSYTADGEVEEMLIDDNSKKTQWILTWENGDAVKVVQNIYEPEEVAETKIFEYTYDDKPSAYTGTTLSFALPDGDGTRLARLHSKHNLIEEGYTYNYDENGFLISSVAENDSAFYKYIELTVE